MQEKHVKIENIKKELSQVMAQNTDSRAIETFIESCSDEMSSFHFVEHHYNSSLKKITAKGGAVIALCTAAFFSGRADIINAINACSKNNICFCALKNLVPYIKLSIISHTNTEVMKQIIVDDSVLADRMNEDMFATAVFSENYPMIECLNEIRIYKVSIEMVKWIMEKGNKMLDAVLCNGRRLRSSEIVRSILFYAAETGDPEILKMIRFLAKRYDPSYDGSKEAECNFIKCNSEPNTVVNCIFTNLCLPNKKLVIEYLAKMGIKLLNIGRILAGYSYAMGETRKLTLYDKAIIKSITDMTIKDSYICYEELITFPSNVWIQTSRSNFNLLLKTLSENLELPIILDVCNREVEYNPYLYFDKNYIKLLEMMSSCCRVNPVHKYIPDSLIDQAIRNDKDCAIKVILASGAIEQEVITEMIDVCIDQQSYKCLNEINKYVLSVSNTERPGI